MSQVRGTLMSDQIIDYFSSSFFGDEEDSVSCLEAVRIEVHAFKDPAAGFSIVI